MKGNILNGQLAADYLKTSKGVKRTRIHYLATEQERKMLEDAAKREGVSLSETARRLTFKAIHND